jgi:hypothetical protein
MVNFVHIMGWFQSCQKKSNSVKFWGTLKWKKMDKLYGHLEYFTDIWDTL